MTTVSIAISTRICYNHNWKTLKGELAVETIFILMLLILTSLVFYSGRRNIANKWGAIAGFFFWLGIAKEAVLYNIILST